MTRRLDSNDAQSILALDFKFIDPDRTMEQVIEQLCARHTVGIFDKNDVLQGYCQYNFSYSDIKISWFCANKTYGARLYHEIERLHVGRYSKIILYASLEGHIVGCDGGIDFWSEMGFKVCDIIPETLEVCMEKML